MTSLVTQLVLLNIVLFSSIEDKHKSVKTAEAQRNNKNTENIS